jgi:endonuclease/exonuclease/phosphatase family metal-dependent hydrolase
MKCIRFLVFTLLVLVGNSRTLNADRADAGTLRLTIRTLLAQDPNAVEIDQLFNQLVNDSNFQSSIYKSRNNSLKKYIDSTRDAARKKLESQRAQKQAQEAAQLAQDAKSEERQRLEQKAQEESKKADVARAAEQAAQEKRLKDLEEERKKVAEEEKQKEEAAKKAQAEAQQKKQAEEQAEQKRKEAEQRQKELEEQLKKAQKKEEQQKIQQELEQQRRQEEQARREEEQNKKQAEEAAQQAAEAQKKAQQAALEKEQLKEEISRIKAAQELEPVTPATASPTKQAQKPQEELINVTLQDEQGRDKKYLNNKTANLTIGKLKEIFINKDEDLYYMGEKLEDSVTLKSFNKKDLVFQIRKKGSQTPPSPATSATAQQAQETQPVKCPTEVLQKVISELQPNILYLNVSQQGRNECGDYAVFNAYAIEELIKSQSSISTNAVNKITAQLAANHSPTGQQLDDTQLTTIAQKIGLPSNKYFFIQQGADLLNMAPFALHKGGGNAQTFINSLKDMATHDHAYFFIVAGQHWTLATVIKNKSEQPYIIYMNSMNPDMTTEANGIIALAEFALSIGVVDQAKVWAMLSAAHKKGAQQVTAEQEKQKKKTAQQQQDKKQAAAAPVTFTVASNNVLKESYYQDSRNSGDKAKMALATRKNLFADAFSNPAMFKNADFICLQEWGILQEGILTQAKDTSITLPNTAQEQYNALSSYDILQNGGFGRPAKNTYQVQGGLLTLATQKTDPSRTQEASGSSKFTNDVVHYRAFTTQNASQNGFLVTVFTHRISQKKIGIINTHFKGGGLIGDYNQFRQAQMAEIVTYLKSNDAQEVDAWVICGDFNTNNSKQENILLTALNTNNRLQFKSAFALAAPTVRAFNSTNKTASDQTLDYIFYTHNTLQVNNPTITPATDKLLTHGVEDDTTKGFYSDHAILRVDFSFIQ